MTVLVEASMDILNVAKFAIGIRNSVMSFLTPEVSPGLQEHQIFGVILASAGAYDEVQFINVIKSIICEYVDEETIRLANAAVAFVRSEETDNDSLNIDQSSHMENPEEKDKDDLDFMLYTLAASHAINFDKYINIREQLVAEKYADEKTINSINRIAEYISSIEKITVHGLNHKARILVVDDEVRFARLIKSILSRTGKYEVRLETRGSNAVKVALEFKPDLILLDMLMPDMSGKEVARQIRENKELSHTKVIILSGLLTKAETGDEGKEIGGYLCLAKPVRDNELLHCVEGEISQSIAIN